MQFVSNRKAWGSGSQRWLGSAHATDSAQTVTLDITALSGFDVKVPAGTPLKEVAGGKYAPVAAAEDQLAGFLLTDQELDGEGDVIAPMIWHGRIRADLLPDGAFDVTSLTAVNPQFTIVKEA